MVTTLKRIRVGSAFKIGVVLNGLIFLVFGIVFILLPLIVFSSAGNADVRVYSNTGTDDLIRAIGTASILSLACFYVVGTIGAGIIGGIYFAIGAWLYNLVARWIGGLEIVLIPVVENFGNPAFGPTDEIAQDMADAQKRKRL